MCRLLSRGSCPSLFLLPFHHLIVSMDQIPSQDQNQKDFLSFLFPDPSTDQNRTQDTHQPDHPSHRTLQNFSGSNNHQPLDLMAMSNLASLQGFDSAPTTLPSPAALTPHMLLEQQFKLTQLHQLQQLQNQIQSQIFQQQASHFPSPRAISSKRRSFSKH